MDELRKIDWHSLETSYGKSAEYIPKYFEMIFSKDHATRVDGYRKLDEGLIGQYNYGTASPVAVPLLLELLQDETLKDKDYILSIIDNMLLTSEPVPDDMDSTSRFSQHHLLEIATGQKIIKGLDIYLELLKHPDWRIRSAAGKLVFHWYRFPKSEETRIKDAFRAFKAVETHETVKMHIKHWWELPIPGLNLQEQEFPSAYPD